MTGKSSLHAQRLQELRTEIRDAVSDIAEIPQSEIEDDIGLGQLGFNSLHYTILSAQLGDMLNREVSPTSLFDLPTLNHLVDFVAKELLENSEPSADGNTIGSSVENFQADHWAQREEVIPHFSEQHDAADHLGASGKQSYKGALAIVGIHCRMPKAGNLDQFWANLAQGKDCVEEVPDSRWNWEQIYGRDGNTTYANEGGFLEDIDQFDAGFFRLSPREAELMDPKQRLLLQGVWHTLEDAGYRPSELKGSDVGVFIGSTGDEYANLLIQARHKVDSFTLTGTGRAFISNRVSYFFDWSGPSEVIDTTCSSSLVALHSAQRAINNGDCSAAIVGGISLLMDPYPQISLSKVNVLADDCRCKTFDSRANGYVRSEGLGLVMVKPYAKAIEDNDHIYAVIRGSAVNHGGHSSALTAPNSRAQSALIQKAFRDYQVELDGLGYCEAHGTGTQLGDPIEIEGLKNAIAGIAGEQGLTALPPQSISVGSAKTSIGHCEAAAGIAGLLKVVMCLRNQSIPPVVHLNTVNDKIKLEGSPLYLSRTNQPWGVTSTQSAARKATVSAFGFGGVNAHVIAQEFNDSRPVARARTLVLPVAARDGEQLVQYVRLVRDAVAGADENRLADLLYTFQTGREQLNEKVVFIAGEKNTLLDSMDGFCRGSQSLLITGGVRGYEQSIYGDWSCFDKREVTQAVEGWLEKGVSDWNRLYDGQPKRIPAPVYPFARQSYLPKSLVESSYNKVGYFLDKLEDHRYQILLTTQYEYVRDHVVNGERILPSAAYISFMEDIAYSQLGIRGALCVSNIVWSQPVRFTSRFPVAINFEVESLDNGDWNITCYTFQDEARVEHCAARIKRHSGDLSSEKLSDGTRQFKAARSEDEIYRQLADIGLTFGDSLKTVKQIWYSEHEALSQIQVKAGKAVGQSEPALKVEAVDAIFQTAILHQCCTSNQGELSIPFSVNRLVIHGRMEEDMYVRAIRQNQGTGNTQKNSNTQKYDLLVFDPAGVLVMEIRGAIGLPTRPEKGSKRNTSSSQATRFVERWRSVDIPATGEPALSGHLCIGFHPGIKEQRFASMLNAELIDVQQLDADSRDASVTVLSERLSDLVSSHPSGSGEAGKPALNIVVDAASLSFEQALSWHRTVYFWVQKWIRSRVTPALSMNIVVLHETPNEVSTLLSAMDAFGKAVTHEFPRMPVRTVIIQSDAEHDAPGTTYDLRREMEFISHQAAAGSFRITSDDRHLETLYLETVGDISAESGDWHVDPSKIYLVTGGMGRVGRFVASYLSSLGAKVLLMGRSPIATLSADHQRLLREQAGNWEYQQVDVSDRDSVAQTVAYARNKYGAIGGVIHCAGSPPNALLINKTEKDYERITLGKIAGAYYLDEATRSDDLSVFFVCSSLVSITGHVGCTDYAFANRALERFTEFRTSLFNQGQRHGKSVCVAWPAWRGGMDISEKELAFIGQKGFIPLDDDQALNTIKSVVKHAGITEQGDTGISFIASGNKRLYEPFLHSLYLSDQNITLKSIA